MPEWLVEHGIAETRAALVDDGQILETRIELAGTVPAGSVLESRLTSIGQNGRNAVAKDGTGTEYLLPHGARGKTEGSSLNIEVTREAIPGSEPWKRPIARVASSGTTPLPPLEERLGARLLVFPNRNDELGNAGWNDVLEDAASGTIPFSSGQLRLFATPAMTLIDVDGPSPPAELMITGARQAARAILRLDIGGNIGVDLPTVREKSARSSAVEQVDELLGGTRFERTAINGFGLLQIVRPRLRPSLLELAQDQAAYEARALLRRAAFEPPGSKRLVAHPKVIALLTGREDWTRHLARQLGGTIELRSTDGITMSGGYAESI
ncbi:MAG TPA: ribonuclease [Sphingomicrobium sp.]|nr:ribonuclease [Sphingomicrobium sp.]